MIDQADKDFSKEDLPCPTVVMEQVNKMNKNFIIHVTMKRAIYTERKTLVNMMTTGIWLTLMRRL